MNCDIFYPESIEGEYFLPSVSEIVGDIVGVSSRNSACSADSNVNEFAYWRLLDDKAVENWLV